MITVAVGILVVAVLVYVVCSLAALSIELDGGRNANVRADMYRGTARELGSVLAVLSVVCAIIGVFL